MILPKEQFNRDFDFELHEDELEMFEETLDVEDMFQAGILESQSSELQTFHISTGNEANGENSDTLNRLIKYPSGRRSATVKFCQPHARISFHSVCLLT